MRIVGFVNCLFPSGRRHTRCCLVTGVRTCALPILIASAERYYRIMYYGGAESWNLRDTHMFETLQNLLEAKGPNAKAVVWALNSHIGDARFTDMGVSRGELNIG